MKRWWIVIGVFITVLLLILVFFVLQGLYNNHGITDDYYLALLESCHNDCCRGSVREMAKRGFREPVDFKCPDGYINIIARCEGAIAFCYKTQTLQIDDIEDCFKLQDETMFNPETHSNIASDPLDYVNQSTRKADSCIFNYVDKHKEITLKTVCDKVVSPYYYYLCRQRIAINNNDSSLCNLGFLGKQSNVDGCFNVLSIQLQNRSLCNQSSTPAVCLSSYDYRYNNGTKPINTLGPL